MAKGKLRQFKQFLDADARLLESGRYGPAPETVRFHACDVGALSDRNGWPCVFVGGNHVGPDPCPGVRFGPDRRIVAPVGHSLNCVGFPVGGGQSVIQEAGAVNAEVFRPAHEGRQQRSQGTGSLQHPRLDLPSLLGLRLGLRPRERNGRNPDGPALGLLM